MKDDQIIELYWQRDENAIRETQTQYGKYCHAIAEHILHDDKDAEECVNDTWLQAWNNIPPQRPTYLQLYLAKITRNLAFGRYRTSHAKKRGGGEANAVLEELAECLAGTSDVETEYLGQELADSINRFVRSLPELKGNLFVRRYFYTEPVSEIAKRYGLTENHIMVILSRVRKKLKIYLEKEGYEI